jgi:hypothetical protein
MSADALLDFSIFSGITVVDLTLFSFCGRHSVALWSQFSLDNPFDRAAGPYLQQQRTRI